jgi:glycosyltransferase involved in cell wall biosynthesis
MSIPKRDEQPRVSVVTATHNRAERLRALLDSLRVQTLASELFETIVVDDGSADATPAVLESEARRPGLNLRVLHRARSGGPAAARNDGWNAANASIIAFIDDDCIADPRWLESGLRACLDNPGGIVQGRVDPIPSEASFESPFTRTLRVHSAGPYYQTCNIFYPRSLLAELGGFDADAFRSPGGEDTDLAWRAISRGTPTTFAGRARAYHAVNRIGLFGRLRVAGHWSESMLVYKRHPGLREAVFTKGIFWKPWHYALLRVAIALILPRRLRFLRPYLTIPYVRSLETRRRHEGGSLVHALFYPLEDLVEITTMVHASVRHRMLVL